MATDMRRHSVVLVGVPGTADGNQAPLRTWVGDGHRWQQVPNAAGPVGIANPNVAPSVAYDLGRNEVMLLDSARDLWGWNGRRWERVLRARPGHPVIGRIAPDPTGRGLLGFGSDPQVGQGGVREERGVLYHFAGGEWHRLAVGGTPGLVEGVAVDLHHHRLVAVGAAVARLIVDAGAGSDSTFVFDGSRWSSQPLPDPLIDRVNFGLAYDGRTQAVTLFGGVLDVGFVMPPAPPVPVDTWAWTNGSWHQVHR
jgi:hypothetical protein